MTQRALPHQTPPPASDGQAAEDVLQTAGSLGEGLEPILVAACDQQLSDIHWFRTSWQRGGALTAYARLANGADEPVLDLADTVSRPTITLTEPGLYRLQTPGSTRLLAVNTDPAESALPRIDADRLDSWQASLDRATPASAPATAAPQSAQAPVSEIPLAPFLLMVLLAAVLAEPLWANLFAGRHSPMAETRS